MKKKTLLFFFIFFYLHFSFSQNLVLNPSFEQYSFCPDDAGQIYKATGWVNFGGTPDFFSGCDIVNGIGVPANQYGYQSAVSGISYSGIFSYWKDSPNFREYIGRQLMTPLIIGTKYFVSVKVSPAYAPLSQISVTLDFSNNMGLLFTTIPLDSNTSMAVNRYHIKNNNIISDTTNWTVIKGVFVADSSYNYVAIGNFLDDNSISVDSSYNPANSPTHTSYYYIDNVCITTDSLYNESYIITGSNNITVPDNRIIIYPNPAKNSFSIKNYTSVEITSTEIFSSYGEIKNSFEKTLFPIDISMLSGGVYFVKINFRNKESIIKPIIKIN